MNQAYGPVKRHARPDEMLHFSLDGCIDDVESLLAFTFTSIEPCGSNEPAVACSGLSINAYNL